MTEMHESAQSNPGDDEANDLSPQEAANLIGVSLPTLIRLLDDGQLPFHLTAGDHRRRIPHSAALEYLRLDLERRRSALDELAVDSEALGFFED